MTCIATNLVTNTVNNLPQIVNQLALSAVDKIEIGV